MNNSYSDVVTVLCVFHTEQCCRLVIDLLFHSALFRSARIFGVSGVAHPKQEMGFVPRVGSRGVIEIFPEERFAVTDGRATTSVFAHQRFEIGTTRVPRHRRATIARVPRHRRATTVGPSFAFPRELRRSVGPFPAAEKIGMIENRRDDRQVCSSTV